MTHGVLQLLLIASLLACPLRCKSNVCASTEHQCTPDVCSVEKTCGPCCEASSSLFIQESHSTELPCDHGPYKQDAPCENHCQCICDGAVYVGGIDELRQGANSPLYELLSTVALLSEQLARCKTWTMIDTRLAQSGRGMRTLHSSWLC